MTSDLHEAVSTHHVIDQLRAELRARDEKIENLRVALESSRVIGAAVGVMMNAQKLTYDQAFHRLNETSQHTNIKLRDLADLVLFTGVVDDSVRRTS